MFVFLKPTSNVVLYDIDELILELFLSDIIPKNTIESYQSNNHLINRSLTRTV
jgi:hypothetical protein